MPGPFIGISLPSLKTTPRSYSLRILIAEDRNQTIKKNQIIEKKKMLKKIIQIKNQLKKIIRKNQKKFYQRKKSEIQIEILKS